MTKPKPRKSTPPQSNSTTTHIRLVALLVFLSLSMGTLLHDPGLHGVIAFINGWDISEYQAGLMFGSTQAMIGADSVLDAGTWDFWTFYMFPAMFLFIATLAINFKRPSFSARIIGIVILALNLSSLIPENPSTDSYKAGIYLTTQGWSEFSAFTFQWLIFSIFLGMFIVYLSITTEDSNKDVASRVKSLKFW